MAAEDGSSIKIVSLFVGGWVGDCGFESYPDRCFLKD